MKKQSIAELLRTQSIYRLPLRVTYYAAPVPNDYRARHTIDSQIVYCMELIQKTPSWTLVDGYVDGPSRPGLCQSRREFNRMVIDAVDNQFDLIITAEAIAFMEIPHSFPRFVRMLRDVGVGVFFPQYGTEYNTFSARIDWLFSKLVEHAFMDSIDFDSGKL